MRIHQISSTNSQRKAKRVGRGISAGQGKTAGRGTKGQKARTGANSNIPRTFEGAATSFIQRLPKLKGFKSHRVKPYALNQAKIARVVDNGSVITVQLLLEKGLITTDHLSRGVKIVGSSAPASTSFTVDTTDSRLRTTKRLQAK
ncbi:50S ribosomal protein L15 [Patescibacteria group bacterium]|nr:50S ribosomal protein L15 [Patescibacteria group bacterium]